jgi:4'-phosphopantetheinyl transferase EntD
MDGNGMDTFGAAFGLPEIDGLKIETGPVADHLGELHPEELSAIEKAAEKRRWEFATGRTLARRAMSHLGLGGNHSVLRGESREPVWPAGIVGSITHADQQVVAAAASAARFRSVGVDLELPDRVEPKLYDRLFTAAEQAMFDGEDPRFPGLLFSAKEAGYKATFPLVGKFIGFKEAEIDVDWPRRQFRFRYIGAHQANRVMESGIGYFAFHERYVLSLVIIP